MSEFTKYRMQDWSLKVQIIAAGIWVLLAINLTLWSLPSSAFAQFRDKKQATQLDSVNLSSDLLYKTEIAKNYKRHTGTGALIGIGAGGIFGGLLGWATYRECNEEGWGCFMRPGNRGQSAKLGAVIGGVFGGVIGALIGYSTKTERKPKAVRVSMVMPSNGIREVELHPTFTIRLSFGKSKQNR